MEETGQIPTDGRTGLDLPGVLRRAWEKPFQTRSDFARANADTIAALSSLGYLTTQTGAAEFGRLWLLTPAGLSHLWTLNGLDA